MQPNGKPAAPKAWRKGKQKYKRFSQAGLLSADDESGADPELGNNGERAHAVEDDDDDDDDDENLDGQSPPATPSTTAAVRKAGGGEEEAQAPELVRGETSSAADDRPWYSRCWHTLVESTGALAGICTTAAFIPQVYEIWLTGDTSGLSLSMYSIFVFGVFLWMVYGVCKRAGSLVLANLITFVLAGYIFFHILDRVVLHPENYAEDVDPSYDDD